MTQISRTRRLTGLAALVVGIGFNPWTAALLSPDGQIEAWSRLYVFGFDGVMIVIGLLCLFASRSLIVSLTVSVVAGLISLILLDLVARPVLKSQLYYRPEERFKDRVPELPSLSRFEANVNFSNQAWGDLAAMTTDPNLRETRQVNFITDAHGYRNDHADTSQTLDVIIIGDSFGAGTGTSQEDIWDSQLRSRYGLKTYNLSIPGYGPWNELITLKRELSRLTVGPQTTVVWAIFGGNDFDEPCYNDLDPQPQGFWPSLGVRLVTFYRRSPVRMIASRALSGLNPTVPRDTAIVSSTPDGRSFLFYSQYLLHDRRSLDEVRQLPGLPKLRRVMAEMARFTKESGVKVLVLYLPSSYSVYGWMLDKREAWDAKPAAVSTILAELCSENNLPLLDLEPGLLQEARRLYADSGKLLWWRDDTHWNSYGHAAAARIVNDYLTAAGHNPAVDSAQ